MDLGQDSEHCCRPGSAFRAVQCLQPVCVDLCALRPCLRPKHAHTGFQHKCTNGRPDPAIVRKRKEKRSLRFSGSLLRRQPVAHCQAKCCVIELCIPCYRQIAETLPHAIWMLPLQLIGDQASLCCPLVVTGRASWLTQNFVGNFETPRLALRTCNRRFEAESHVICRFHRPRPLSSWRAYCAFVATQAAVSCDVVLRACPDDD